MDRGIPSSPIKNQQDNNIKIIEGTDESMDSYSGPGVLDTNNTVASAINQHNLFEQTMAQLIAQQLQDENIVFEENLVQQVVEFGYPREYIIRGLNAHDLHYATTSYLLMHFAKRLRSSVISQWTINVN